MGYIAYGVKYWIDKPYYKDYKDMRLSMLDGVYLHSEAQEFNNGWDCFVMNLDDIREIKEKKQTIEDIRLISNGESKNFVLYYYQGKDGNNRGYICEKGNKQAIRNMEEKREVI